MIAKYLKTIQNRRTEIQQQLELLVINANVSDFTDEAFISQARNLAKKIRLCDYHVKQAIESLE